MQKNTVLSLSLLLLLGFIWGTGYSIARFAMINGVHPLGYSFWQSLGPAILLCLMQCRNPGLLIFKGNYIKYYLICSLTGIVIPNTIMYFAAAHLPAGLLAVIVNIVPIICYPLALWQGQERFNWGRLIGIGLALLGLMLVILPKSSLPQISMLPWAILVLVTPISFACCSIYIGRAQPKDSNSLALSAGTLLFSSFILAPLVYFTHSFYALHLPLTLPDQVILLEIALSSLGYVLFFQLIKIAGAVYYSMVDTIVSLTGLLWGFLIFDERLNMLTGIAVSLIILGLLLVTKRQKNSHNTHESFS
jgi:drug/metabolite transporter (DMT)-like permease